MFSKTASSESEEMLYGIDEGWWASVLTDETIQGSSGSPGNKQIIFGNLSIDWKRIQEIQNKDEIITLHVSSYNRGGILVETEGVQGFVPVSHLIEIASDATEEERLKKFIAYVGQDIKLKVIECEPSQERIVFSERAALAGQGQRKKIFQTLQPGDPVQGIVTNITEFGVFVDLGGVEGLIHVSELSWGRVQHPSQILKINQNIQALVLQVNEKSGRVALSLKRTIPNPWREPTNRFQTGDILPATITSITNYGLFARLEFGIEGLIHISSLNLQNNRTSMDEIYSQGQQLNVKILHIDPERRRLGLTLVVE